MGDNIRVTRSRFNQKICKVIIPRKNDLDKVALERPAKRIHRTQSVANLQPNSPPPQPIVTQLDLGKIRSILMNPIGKPRRISFTRRNTMPSVAFKLPDPSQGNDDSSNQPDDAPLIDFTDDDNNSSANTTMENVSQPNTAQTATNQNSIFDDFDSFASTADSSVCLTPLPFNRDAITPSVHLHRSIATFIPSSSVLSPSNSNVITSTPRANRSVPKLLPIKSVSLPSNGKENTPSPRLRRSIPNLMPLTREAIRNNTPSPRLRRSIPNLMPITREAIRNALQDQPSTSSGYFYAADINLPDRGNMMVNATTFDQSLYFDSRGEQYGRLPYDSDSD